VRAVVVVSALLWVAAGPTPGVAQGQGVLMGIVTDTAGHPVSAILEIDSVPTTITNRSGGYSIELAPGQHVLTIQAIGFNDFRSPRLLIREGDTTVHHFMLTDAPPLPESIWRGCSLEELPEGSVCLNPARVEAAWIRVHEVGEWVFRTRRDWETFWSDHLPAWNVGRHPAPQINWKTDFLVAVGRGAISGCNNWHRYVNRVLLYRDRTVVVLGPEFQTGELTCAAIMHPVDVVVLPRGYGTVKFEELNQER
jgi:hypothetical protein